jgi:ubiquinone/menaquinone biosynthesis C-methylase UbiE
MNERVYNNGIDRLRAPERIARLEVEKVVNLCLSGKDIKSVLDVGTGSGIFAEEFNKRGLKVSAIDTNPDMISAFKEYLPGLDIQLAPAEKIPFEDGSSDIVFMGLVLHEVDDYSKALSEAYRTAVKEVCILEWEYLEQESGPPIEHRLKSPVIEKLAHEAGFINVEVIKLTNFVLYKLSK